MKLPRRLGLLRVTEEALSDIGANVEMLRAYSQAMGPFFVISSTFNYADGTFDQILCDPQGLRLNEVAEGALIPELKVIISKLRPVDLSSPQYSCTVHYK